MELTFCTTNTHKFKLSQVASEKHGIKINQLPIEVDEIQSEDAKLILDHKVRAIYEKVKKPLIVTDDSWNIPSLNGFPGAYMKSINHWLAPEDWLALMKNQSDKRIFLERRLAFIDETGVTTFDDVSERKFIDTVSDKDGVSILRIISLPENNIPINEVWMNNPESLEAKESIWEEFFEWYKNRP